MSPEYAMSGVISTKTDVYSFGVLLLEIVSGKKNNCDDYPLNLIGYVSYIKTMQLGTKIKFNLIYLKINCINLFQAWKLWNQGEALKLVDTMLNGSCPHIQVIRCIHIGLLCTQDQAKDRPSMLDVISFLSNENTQLPPPIQPSLYTINGVKEAKQHKSCSINEITNSMTSGR